IMAYVRTYYRANFVSGMDEDDKGEFLGQKFREGCDGGLGGVIIGRPRDGAFVVLEGDSTDVQSMVQSLDNASELVDNQAVYTEQIASHDEGLALYLEDSVDATCNYDGSS
ncbi:MAG: hypothetical protein ACOCV2_14150, partial [Persicimonas sp.]